MNMLHIDDREISETQITGFQKLLAEKFDSLDFQIKRLAVCTTDVWEWLALVFYCREKNLGIAPLHPDTPFSAAVEKAEAMGCNALWWQNADGLQGLKASSDVGSGLVQMSSGTTGAPKVIVRSWKAIDEEIYSYNHLLNFSPAVVPVLVCSVTHSYGLICGVLASLARGAVPHILTSWNPKYAHRVLSNYAEAILYSSPPFIHSLAQMFPQDKLPYAVMTSGSLLPEAWFVDLRTRFRHFFQQYGCSEVGCITIAKDPESADVIGSPLPYLRLTAKNNNENSPAELLVHLKDKTIRTQDLVFQDERGDWHFCSRMDDTIIVSGINVYPAEVENILARMPGVDEAVVYRKNDDLVGQRVAAVYSGARDISLPQLRTWCTQHLARHQWPSYWQRVTSIPRMANGKISRRLLAEIDLTEFTPASDSTETEVSAT